MTFPTGGYPLREGPRRSATVREIFKIEKALRGAVFTPYTSLLESSTHELRNLLRLAGWGGGGVGAFFVPVALRHSGE